MDKVTHDGTLDEFDQIHAEALTALARVATSDVKAYYLLVARDAPEDPDSWTCSEFYSCPLPYVAAFERTVRDCASALTGSPGESDGRDT